MTQQQNKHPKRALAIVIGVGGLGLAVARRLGQQYRLLLVDINADLLAKLTHELDAEGCEVHSCVCDVTHQTSVDALAEAVKTLGGFRALVNVAGLSPSMADWQTIMAVNLQGPTRIANALLPLASYGSVALFVTSLAAHTIKPDTAVISALNKPLDVDFLAQLVAAWGREPTTIDSYSLSKNALVRMCEQFAASWGQQQARILSVSPGLIASPMGLREFKSQPQKIQLLEKTPLARQGSLHEIVDAIDFLISDRASFISGTNLLVDGGLSAALKHSVKFSEQSP